MKIEAERRLHRRTQDRPFTLPSSALHAAFLLGFLLAGWTPRVEATAPVSVSGLAATDGRDPRYPEVTIRPGSASSYTRALLASLDARPPVPAQARPRRAVSAVKPAPAGASGQGAQTSARSQPGDLPRAGKARGPVEIVDGTGPGQTGYVHFFLLETPEGEGEIQIGIELADGRIAWSFPEAGVGVAPFMRSGTVEVGGRPYGVEHLYGLRPFPDQESMAALRAALWDRVSPLVDGKTPYCNPFLRAQSLCLSCLGFVLEALFPGRMPGSPAMPADFPRTRSRLYYTTDDLLLYLTGFHEIPTAEARAKRIEELKLPSYLKEELWQLVEAFDMKDAPGAVDTGKMKNASDKPPAARTYTRTPPQRKRL